MATQGTGLLDWRARAAAVADPERPPVRLPGALITELYAHARECYPEECCGLLIGPPGALPHRVLRCTNVQSRRKSEGESDLDARHAFWIDERELLTALRDAEQAAEALRGVYHSHVDTEAYLSHTDAACAAGPDGVPLWEGVPQIVVSVREGKVQGAAWFEWRTDPAGEDGWVGCRLEQAG